MRASIRDRGASGNVYALAIQEDGRVVLGGMFSRINGVDRYRIARLHSDGSLDPSFDPGVGADRNVLAVAIQGDGKILIGRAVHQSKWGR